MVFNGLGEDYPPAQAGRGPPVARWARCPGLIVRDGDHVVLSVLKMAGLRDRKRKGLEGQSEQGRLLLGKHRRHLVLSGAVNAGVRPALLPAVEVPLPGFRTQPLCRLFLACPRPDSTLRFRSGWVDTARQRHHPVVGVSRRDRTDSGLVVGVGGEHNRVCATDGRAAALGDGDSWR
jgi:hypothetical protein